MIKNSISIIPSDVFFKMQKKKKKIVWFSVMAKGLDVGRVSKL